MNVVYCGKISCSYLQYLLRYELFSHICGQVRTDGRTDGQTDRQKAMHMSLPCNLHRWAKKWDVFFIQNEMSFARALSSVYNYSGLLHCSTGRFLCSLYFYYLNGIRNEQNFVKWIGDNGQGPQKYTDFFPALNVRYGPPDMSLLNRKEKRQEGYISQLKFEKNRIIFMAHRHPVPKSPF